MDTCRTVIFNPSYELYNDYDRIVLMSSPEASVLDKSYRLYIHPGIASFFSFFNGTCTLEESFQRAAKFYNTDVATVENLFSKFYNNPKKVGLKYDGENFIFPPNVLVDNREGVKRDTLSPEVMTCKGPYNYDRARLHYPKSLVICINLSCVTDCVYCYANKAHNYKPMPTQALLDFISEAARLHVRDIDFTGGEFFLHKDWREILKCLIANGYNPEISTKVPVSPASLREAREIGLKCVQYSLDTLSPEKACATLNVNRHYIGNIRKSIEAANNLGFDLVIKPTLINSTCTLENVKEILEFTKSLRSVRRMVVTTAGYTMYKSEENYQNLRPTEQQAKEVYDRQRKVWCGKDMSGMSPEITEELTGLLLDGEAVLDVGCGDGPVLAQGIHHRRHLQDVHHGYLEFRQRPDADEDAAGADPGGQRVPYLQGVRRVPEIPGHLLEVRTGGLWRRASVLSGSALPVRTFIYQEHLLKNKRNNGRPGQIHHPNPRHRVRPGLA